MCRLSAAVQLQSWAAIVSKSIARTVRRVWNVYTIES